MSKKNPSAKLDVSKDIKKENMRNRRDTQGVILVPLSAQAMKDEVTIAQNLRKKERSMASYFTEEKPGRCCACCYIDKKRRNEENAILIWHRKYCYKYEDFTSSMELLIQNYNTSTLSVRAVISNLTYWDDPSPGIEGLSIIGSYIWLITEALHFLEERDLDEVSSISETVVNDIQLFYQDVAANAEIFLDSVDEYFQSVHRMRADGYIVVVKMIEKLHLQDLNLLKKYPLNKKNKPRPRRHMGSGLDKDHDHDDDDNLFHLRWKDQKIVCSRMGSEWLQFRKLHASEKIEITRSFLQRTHDIIDTATEDVKHIANKMSIVEVNDKAVRSQAKEITGALRNFAKKYKRKGPRQETEEKHIRVLLEEFWSSLDRLHDDGYELLRIAQETRDIIRTCYVYVDVFYRMALPDYDNFLMCVRKRNDQESKKKEISCWEKLIMNNNEQNKLSEVMKFLCLSDYTTSIYQLVVQKHGIQAEGITLKLKNIDDDANETWGLVSGVDVRKSIKSSKTVKTKTSGGKSVKNIITLSSITSKARK